MNSLIAGAAIGVLFMVLSDREASTAVSVDGYASARRGRKLERRTDDCGFATGAGAASAAGLGVSGAVAFGAGAFGADAFRADAFGAGASSTPASSTISSSSTAGAYISSNASFSLISSSRTESNIGFPTQCSLMKPSSSGKEICRDGSSSNFMWYTRLIIDAVNIELSSSFGSSSLNPAAIV